MKVRTVVKTSLCIHMEVWVWFWGLKFNTQTNVNYLYSYNSNAIQDSCIGGGKLVKCPDCGAEVATLIKEWDVSPKLHVKLYECCGKKFRVHEK